MGKGAAAVIELKQVTAGYPGRRVLDQVDLTLEQGKITSLIGPNGCGKTTLLRAACGLLPLEGGQVLFHGRPLKAFGRKEFARMVSVLPQSRDVPSIRVEQLVAHGRYPHLAFGRSLTAGDREKIRWAMEVTGTVTLRDKELTQLSGGERQRVYLAMTLCQDTEALFLDEPTTYLDIGQKYEMLDLVRQVNRMGKTVVMVLHDLSLAFSYSHRVVVLDQGRVAAQGDAQKVFDSGIPAQVFGVASQALPVEGLREYLFYQKRTGFEKSPEPEDNENSLERCGSYDK